MTCWNWYGRHFASTCTVPGRGGENASTHLLDLGKAVALHAHRIKEPVTARIIDSVLECVAGRASPVRVSRSGARPATTAPNLSTSVKGVRTQNVGSNPPLKNGCDGHGTQISRTADCRTKRFCSPSASHCAEAGSDEFFIGARDAGLVAGVSFRTAARFIRKLCNDGHLEKHGERRQLRHAQTYRLINGRTFVEKRNMGSQSGGAKIL